MTGKNHTDEALRTAITDLAEKMHASPKNELTPVKRKLIKSHVDIVLDRGEIENAAFQHSVLCQTFLPYNDPGELRAWESRDGNARLLLEAGRFFNEYKDEWQDFKLPYGARARLILAFINTQAVKSQDRVINVEESLSAFIRKLGLYREGKTIAMIKEQLSRLAASRINIAFVNGTQSVPHANLRIIKGFDLWFPKDEKQRVLWTSTIKVSDDYFNQLIEHAVPLDERALAALSNNALAMDIYAWLAQRLHRVKGQEFIAWANLKGQFGGSYGRMDNFKRVFRETLKKVLYQYPNAKIEEIPNKGFTVYNSPPPILKSLYVLNRIESQGEPTK